MSQLSNCRHLPTPLSVNPSSMTPLQTILHLRTTGHWHMSGIGYTKVLLDFQSVKSIDYIIQQQEFKMVFTTLISKRAVQSNDTADLAREVAIPPDNSAEVKEFRSKILNFSLISLDNAAVCVIWVLGHSYNPGNCTNLPGLVLPTGSQMNFPQ